MSSMTVMAFAADMNSHHYILSLHRDTSCTSYIYMVTNHARLAGQD